jgi:hypothetical protein
LTAQVQFFTVGTSGTDFNISSATATHTFNLPTASATNRGALSSADWTTFNNKENAITAGTTAQYYRGDKTFQTLNTSVVPELTNLYYTEARVNANANVAANTARHNAVTLGTANGLSLSTQQLSLGLASAGVTGALSGTDWSTFNSKQQALNGTGFVKISGTTISYDNSTYYLASNPSAFIALTALSGTAPIQYNNTTGAISITQASGSTNGFLSSTDWNTFNNKTSNVGTVTSVAALTLGTTGTDLSSSVANGTTTPVITLNVPTASATNRGALSAADWTTFNNKQNALTNPVTGTGTAGQVAYWSSGSAITGESNLFWDATNDRLGIGRNNPSQRLDILGSGTVYANIENSDANIAAVITKNTSKTFTTGLVTDYWAVIDATSGSNTRLMIESGGNVLINTTTNVTGANLNVNGNIRTAAPTGTNAENWRLGRALLATSADPEDRWIRVQLGTRIYDILAIDRGLA